jgi:2-polyprenyl-6-hydroxyphenyl methylase/3-demethylubiquinone-9 3-methyltransferase
VDEGDILNADSLAALGHFDIVYSWGVLHHTGQMWTAIDNASRLGKQHNSQLWISLYTKGPDYPEQLELKQQFNRATWLRKKEYVLRYLVRSWRNERRIGKTFAEWFWRGRGMTIYHDTVDWLGGLPYEVASTEEVRIFLTERGWNLDRVKEGEACTVYLFRR